MSGLLAPRAAAPGGPAGDAGAGLQLRAVDHRYGALRALAGVSLRVTRGEHLALLGPSGCGKSTLLRLLAGLETPSAGAACLDGAPIAAGDDRLGIMFQQPLLYPWLTVAQNVAFAGTLRAGRALPAERVGEALATVGMLEHGARFPAQLSGGMAQRAALARALLRRPDFLLLDEPFSALDAVTRLRLQRWLTALARRERLTLVVVTHDVDEALALADRVLLLAPAPGRLAAEWRLPPREARTADRGAWRATITDALWNVLETPHAHVR